MRAYLKPFLGHLLMHPLTLSSMSAFIFANCTHSNHSTYYDTYQKQQPSSVLSPCVFPLIFLSSVLVIQSQVHIPVEAFRVERPILYKSEAQCITHPSQTWFFCKNTCFCGCLHKDVGPWVYSHCPPCLVEH